MTASGEGGLSTSVAGRRANRLLVVTASYPAGPNEAFVEPELRALARCGVEVHVAPLHPRGAVREGGPGTWHVERVFSPAVLRTAAESWPRLRKRHIARSLAHSRGPRNTVWNLAALPKVLWLARLVDHLEIDHVHAYWCDTSATAAMFTSRVTGVPWSMTAHRGDIASGNLLGEKLEVASLARVISRSGPQLAPACGVVSDRWRVIRLGVDLPERIARPAIDRRPRVMMVARLVPLKRHTDLLQAVEILRRRGVDFDVRIAGDGPLRREIESEIKDRDLGGTVQVVGDLPHSDLVEMYRRGDVDVVTLTSTIEGVPASLLEAMAHAIPVVATPVGGVPELVDESCGALVPVKDPLGLADALECLLRSPTVRRRLGDAGQQRVRELHGADAVASELVQAIFDDRRITSS